MRSFRRSARLWERNAEIDPLWAILALPGKEGRAWDPDEFFATGERDVAELFRDLDERGVHPHPRRALDFGCGVGRLTRALASRFEQVDGVDVSPTMVAAARRYGGASERVRFHVGATPDLRSFASGSFDLVLSILVLQHIPAPLGETYLSELARVTAPEGALLVQVPAVRRRPAARRGGLRRLIARVSRRERIELEMYGIPRATVERVLRAAACEILDVRSDGWAGDEWESYVYLARKPAA